MSQKDMRFCHKFIKYRLILRKILLTQFPEKHENLIIIALICWSALSPHREITQERYPSLADWFWDWGAS